MGARHGLSTPAVNGEGQLAVTTVLGWGGGHSRLLSAQVLLDTGSRSCSTLQPEGPLDA